ncbi:MAG: hypothetical protein IJ679_06950 [Lachnospiraceae bacterium]|nr:hypothetical protein [Lachnospiraceae bacterium]
MNIEETMGGKILEKGTCEARFEEIWESCRRKNETVDNTVSRQGELSLMQWLAFQRGKWESNRQKTPMQKRSDFVEICAAYVRERLDQMFAAKTVQALERGCLHTADHLGGLYSPQSFQGDLLFGQMLGADCIPCFAAGSVTLHSSTYGRGIQYYSEMDAIGKLPLFAGKYAKYAASLTGALEENALERAEKRAASIEAGDVRQSVLDILQKHYRSKEVMKKSRFADQVTALGVRLSADLGEFFADYPLIYLESEEVSARLFCRDALDESSLVSWLFSNRAILSELNREKDGDGTSLAGRLFRGNDGRGHMFPMRLGEDGVLRGASIRGEELCVPGDLSSLAEAVQRKIIFVAPYLRAWMLAFARGFTWYGGIFQSLYLPKWQQKTVAALKRAHFVDLAAEVEKWDTSGYISGPIFALHETAEGAFPAGPVEWRLHPPSERQIEELLSTTTVESAHKMGVFEFYPDLFPAEQRMRGWYEAVGRWMKEAIRACTTIEDQGIANACSVVGL